MQQITNPIKPEVRNISHRLGQVTSQVIEIITDVTVYNPNPVSIPIKNVSADVSIDGFQLGHTEGDRTTLEKNTETVIPVSTLIGTQKATTFVAEYIKRKENSTILIEGNIVFDLTVTDYTYPFTYIKVFNMKPEVRSITHEWGPVTSNSTEVITTVVVFNPIPAPIPIKNCSANITIDGISLGQSAGNNISLKQEAETPVVIYTRIDKDKISDFWAEHLRRGENSTVVIDGNINFDMKVADYSYPFTYSKAVETNILTRLHVNTPVVVEKTYKVPVIGNEITAFKATIKSSNASWGKIERDLTELNVRAIIHNDNSYSIPSCKMVNKVSINEIPLAVGESVGSYSFPSNADTEVMATANLKTSLMDQWFVSHLIRNEKSTLKVETAIMFNLPGSVAKVLSQDSFTIPIWEENIEFETNMLSSVKPKTE